MRGIGQTLSRLPAVQALVAGAAILAGFPAMEACAQPVVHTAPAQSAPGTEETALANPRVAPRGPYGVALLQPLLPSEAVRLSRIFLLQARGALAEATRETGALDISTPLGQAMLGEVLADRYLGRYSRPAAPELRAWLDRWNTLPDAPAIHALLLTRLPRGASRPPAPAQPMLGDDDGDADRGVPVPEETEPVGHRPARNHALDRAVYRAAREGSPTTVGRLIAREGVSSGYAALLRGEAAQILFTLGRDDEALAVGAPGAGGAALAGYEAGLAAWRLDRPAEARPLFEAAWAADISTSALRAGAAFWAARTHLRLRDPEGYFHWLERAAAQRTTFYGLIARRMLGLGISVGAPLRETLGEADVEAVAAQPAGLRAFALVQIGEHERAEAALRSLWPAAKRQLALGRAVMLVAERAGLPDLAAEFADLVQAHDGQPRLVTRFPVPRLRPAGGFTVDPAMIYALARSESDFDAGLVSSSGAAGLLQIMPETARFVTREDGEGRRLQLRDPAINLAIGQRYLGYLAGSDAIGGDLIRLLASYNAGPGGFGRWAGGVQDRGDPLLFIESIPIDETRAFVPRVLAYTWIYAARLRLPAPTLDELAAGQWPRYHTAAADVATLLH
jgi:soluble lytic murein transglycosylase